MIETYFTAKQLATAMGVTPHRLKSWAKRGEIPYTLFGNGKGRRYLFSARELEAWAEGRKHYEVALTEISKKVPY